MSESVADFPQTWQKPSCGELLEALEKLRVEPPVWNAATPTRVILDDYHGTARGRQEATAYISTVIRSSLAWLPEVDREALWTIASQRLAERCGRLGMGEITRRWPFEGGAAASGRGCRRGFDLTLREPSITGDSLGLKTWGSSYVLARCLDEIAAKSLSHLLVPHDDDDDEDQTSCDGNSSSSSSNGDNSRSNASVNVLELGSGTGLLGMAAAAKWRTAVALSDLPEIVPNLAFNAAANEKTIASQGGSVSVGALTWGSPEESDGMFREKNRFEIIVVADALYDDEHPALLASAVQDQLARGPDARVVLMSPLRDPTTRSLLAEFRAEMARSAAALACLEEHTLQGQDDWGDDEEGSQIECWWGVFGRA